MCRRLLFLGFFLCLVSGAKAQVTGSVHHLSGNNGARDNTIDGWRFAAGDSLVFAQPSFRDEALPLVSSLTIAPLAGSRGAASTLFRGVGWLRCRLQADSAMAGQALALGIWQNGASEIYLDGRLIVRNGQVGTEANTVYENPQGLPFALTLPDTGLHVLAVRFANWHYNSRNPVYLNKRVGFRLALGDANAAFGQYQEGRDVISFTSLVLFGLFGALALLHLMFFLYYRVEKSNRLFSLFCCSVAVLFLSPYLRRISGSPAFILGIDYYSYFLVLFVCFILCSLLMHLFAPGHRVLRRVNIVFFPAMVLVYLLYKGPAAVYYLIVTIITTGEVIYILARAVLRKVPGARIIGGGLLLLLLFIVSILVVLAITGDVNIGDDAIGMVATVSLLLAILSIPVSLSAFLARNFAITSRNLQRQLAQVEELSAQKQRLLQNRQQELEHEVAMATAAVRRQHDQLIVEKKKTDDLLLNILPGEIAEELKQSGRAAARLYEHVTVLFTDFVDFTRHSEQLSPTALVDELHECFKAFDAIVEQHGLEKIKTIGDAYVAVSGLPVSDARHARRVVSAGLAIRDFMAARKRQGKDTFEIRLGIHSGPVVAGIVGVRKFAYDIWGDTVNTAARMEQASIAGKINISAATYELVKADFDCAFRGDIEAKNKGKMGMYFVEGRA